MHRTAGVGALVLGLVLGAGASCGGPADPSGTGSSCFRANECAPGLVCIERMCTSDLSTVDRRPEPVPEAGPRGDESGEGGLEGGSTDEPDGSPEAAPEPESD